MWCLFLIAALAAVAMPTDVVGPAREMASIVDFQPDWQPIFKGIDLCVARRTGETPQAVFVARIDLKEPSIRFLATPSNGDKPGETDGRTTSRFLKEFQCQLAVNASPFSPVGDAPGEPKDIIGVSESQGDLYSKPHGDHAALLFTRDNRVSMGYPPFSLDGAYNAVGGFGMLIVKGEIEAADGERHPRTAAGVSQDGRFLYLIVIDGRQGSYSVGATNVETAQWLGRVGAYDAINLDGGGSASLVIDDGNGGVKLVNRPIHNNLPGLERVNGNHLGVFADRLGASPVSGGRK